MNRKASAGNKKRTMLIWLVALGICLSLITFLNQNVGTAVRDVPISEFISLVQGGTLINVEIEGTQVTGKTFKDGQSVIYKSQSDSSETI